MKYTSLFSAVAIAAAMGTQALATVETNGVGSVDFEDKAIGAAGTVLGGSWTVQTEDQSEVIYAPLSSQDAVDGYTANKHLKLNTEGNELVWDPGVVSEPKSIIEMKVRLVASDTAPAIATNDTTVHAAVYLQVSEPVDANNDGLYAYTASGWSKLDAPFNAELATGSMVALRVLMDYDARTATYEGCVLTDAENNVPVYVNLGTKNMANPTTASGNTLSSIGFKGTGGIDDLFVKEIEETPSTATINFQAWEEGESDMYDSKTRTLDTVLGTTARASFDIATGLVVKSVELFETNAPLDWVEAPEVDSEGNISVSTNNYPFVADSTYVVKITVGEPVPNYTVTFTTERGTIDSASVTVASNSVVANPGAPTYSGEDYTFVAWQLNGADYDFATPVTGNIELVAAWQAASAPATGVEFSTFEILGSAQFTAFSVSGTTATATLSATVQSTGTQTQKTLYAKYETTLGSGTYGYAEATVTAQTAGDPGSVTFTFTVPNGNALFLVGLTNDDGSN